MNSSINKMTSNGSGRNDKQSRASSIKSSSAMSTNSNDAALSLPKSSRASKRDAVYVSNLKTTVTTSYDRIDSETSDIKITSKNVVRNQTETVTSKRGYMVSVVTTASFDPVRYDFVKDYNGWHKDMQMHFLMGKRVDFVLDLASIEARRGAYPTSNAINQLKRLPSLFRCSIEDVSITLPMHQISTDATRLSNNALTAAQYEELESDKLESTISRTFPFIADLVKEIKSFNSLRRLDIVVILDSPLSYDKYIDATDFHVALPFWELREYSGWDLKWTSPGLSENFFAPKSIIHRLNKIQKKSVQADRVAIRGIFRNDSPPNGIVPVLQTWMFLTSTMIGPRLERLPLSPTAFGGPLVYNLHEVLPDLSFEAHDRRIAEAAGLGSGESTMDGVEFV